MLVVLVLMVPMTAAMAAASMRTVVQIVLRVVPVLEVQTARLDAVVEVERVVFRPVGDAVGGADEVVQVPIHTAVLARAARHPTGHKVTQLVHTRVTRGLRRCHS